MVDSITDCTKYYEQDGSLKYYAVTFHYEGLDVTSGWNPIYIYAAQMKDPNDMSEVKSLACAQATVTKALFASAVSTDVINGPVNI